MAPRLETVHGDITDQDVDAVVNAANTHLVNGSGVCGAIHAAAGEGQLEAACRALHGCAVGDAVVTDGFDLRARWIVHAVGPRWEGGERGEREQLASAYRRALEEADRAGARSVAFPALSTGVFGYPPDEAAEVAVATLRAARPAHVERVVLVAFDRATHERYRRLLG